VNGDGRLDLVTADQGADKVSVLLGDGAGVFSWATNHSVGDARAVWLRDLDGDGVLDVTVALEAGSQVAVLLGTGAGSFRTPFAAYGVGNSPVALAEGDFTGDALPDFAMAHANGGDVGVLAGRGRVVLAEDPAGGGVRFGAGRGRLSEASDRDYWSFTGRAGDAATVAIEAPGSPSGSGLYYNLYRADGVRVGGWVSGYYGEGQTPGVELPISGRYEVEVTRYYAYEGEL
jgi:hypothetical protein